MNLDILDGTWAWVWKETPEPIHFCRGLIVRAANGNLVTAPEGFNFATNYQRWRASFAGPLIAWTYLYATSDPQAAAHALTRMDAVAYIIDWEDAQGPAPDAERLRRTVSYIRQFRPGRPVGFSSYPTRAQAEAHGVDWDAGLQVCDFVAPQMYYGYQIAAYRQVLADAKGRYVQLDVEPPASASWGQDVAPHLESGQGVSFWRLGILSAEVRAQIKLFQEAIEVSLTKDDVRAALGLREGEQVATDTDIATILRGDVTHPDSQKNIHADTGALLAKLGIMQAQLTAIKDAITALEGRPGPAPGGATVQGTFTGTIGGGATA